jgi:hypothetical protein
VNKRPIPASKNLRARKVAFFVAVGSHCGCAGPVIDEKLPHASTENRTPPHRGYYPTKMSGEDWVLL